MSIGYEAFNQVTPVVRRSLVRRMLIVDNIEEKRKSIREFQTYEYVLMPNLSTSYKNVEL